MKESHTGKKVCPFRISIRVFLKLVSVLNGEVSFGYAKPSSRTRTCVSGFGFENSGLLR